MSYTTFSQEIGEIHETDGTLSFDVTVTNTGDVADKDVVEVYYNPPYANGGIEKASANLIAFDKTDLLEPGDSQTLTISFCTEDMVSYDKYEHGCYVLEEGEYVIGINENSHDIIDSQVYTVESAIVYDEGNARTGDDVAAVNQFSNADDGVDVFLSRADGFANYDAATQAPKSLTMAPDLKEQFISNVNYDATDEADANAVMPTTNAKNGVKLADLRGKEYDDPLWEDLLDQLSVKEMDTLISLAGYQTQAIDSVGKIATTECDGPVAINNSFTGEATIGFPPAVILANTWNEDLAYEYGNRTCPLLPPSPPLKSFMRNFYIYIDILYYILYNMYL